MCGKTSDSEAVSGKPVEDDYEAIVRRDRAAFDKFYYTHNEKLQRYVHRRMGYWSTTEDIEDLVATAFFKVWQDINKFDPAKGSLAQFLYMKTKNLIAEFGEKKVKRDQSAHLLTMNAAPEVPEDLAIDMRAALAELSPEELRLLDLRYSKSLTSKEIGELTGQRSGTVRAQLHEIRGKLKIILAGEKANSR